MAPTRAEGTARVLETTLPIPHDRLRLTLAQIRAPLVRDLLRTTLDDRLRQELEHQALPLPRRELHERAHLDALRASVRSRSFNAAHAPIVAAPLPKHLVDPHALSARSAALASLASATRDAPVRADALAALHLQILSGRALYKALVEERVQSGREGEGAEAKEAALREMTVEILDEEVWTNAALLDHFFVRSNDFHSLSSAPNPADLPLIVQGHVAAREHGLSVASPVFGKLAQAVWETFRSRTASYALKELILDSVRGTIAFCDSIAAALPRPLSVGAVLYFSAFLRKVNTLNPLSALGSDIPFDLASPTVSSACSRSQQLGQQLDEMLRAAGGARGKYTVLGVRSAFGRVAEKAQRSPYAARERGALAAIDDDPLSYVAELERVVDVLESGSWMLNILPDKLPVTVPYLSPPTVLETLTEPLPSRNGAIGLPQQSDPFAVELAVLRSLLLEPLIHFLIDAAQGVNRSTRRAKHRPPRPTLDDAFVALLEPERWHDLMSSLGSAEPSGPWLLSAVHATLVSRIIMHIWQQRHIMLGIVLLVTASHGAGDLDLAFGDPSAPSFLPLDDLDATAVWSTAPWQFVLNQLADGDTTAVDADSARRIDFRQVALVWEDEADERVKALSLEMGSLVEQVLGKRLSLQASTNALREAAKEALNPHKPSPSPEPIRSPSLPSPSPRGNLLNAHTPPSSTSRRTRTRAPLGELDANAPSEPSSPLQHARPRHKRRKMPVILPDSDEERDQQTSRARSWYPARSTSSSSPRSRSATGTSSQDHGPTSSTAPSSQAPPLDVLSYADDEDDVADKLDALQKTTFGPPRHLWFDELEVQAPLVELVAVQLASAALYAYRNRATAPCSPASSSERALVLPPAAPPAMLDHPSPLERDALVSIFWSPAGEFFVDNFFSSHPPLSLPDYVSLASYSTVLATPTILLPLVHLIHYRFLRLRFALAHGANLDKASRRWLDGLEQVAKDMEDGEACPCGLPADREGTELVLEKVRGYTEGFSRAAKARNKREERKAHRAALS